MTSLIDRSHRNKVHTNSFPAKNVLSHEKKLTSVYKNAAVFNFVFDACTLFLDSLPSKYL